MWANVISRDVNDWAVSLRYTNGLQIVVPCNSLDAANTLLRSILECVKGAEGR